MRVVITQRVDVVPSHGERRDALDQAWHPALERLLGQRILAMPLPNREAVAAALLEEVSPAMIVLTGGNDIGSAPERDATETVALDAARRHGLPVLAVCRGLQMLQHHCGGPLRPVSEHVAAPHAVRAAEDAVGPARLDVNSYHGFGIAAEALAPELKPLYLHADGTVEAARHRELPWLAVMWHPERADADDGAATQWLLERVRAFL